VVVAPLAPSPPDPVLSASVGMIASGAALGALSLLSGQLLGVRLDTWSSRSVLAVAYLAIPGAALPFAVLTWLLRNVRASVAATYTYANPVVAVTLGWAVAGEHLNVETIAGGALVVGAVAVVVASEARGDHVGSP